MTFGIRLHYWVFLSALGLLVGCSKNNSTPAASTTAAISGTVTYTRIPLLYDEAGRPKGLESDSAKFIDKPARGVEIRIYKISEEKDSQGVSHPVYTFATRTLTDDGGKYKVDVPKDTNYSVELSSQFTSLLGVGGGQVNLLAEPEGIWSQVPQHQRLRYVLRKAPDGTAPENNPLPSSKLTQDATVDFKVGLNDQWWLGQVPVGNTTTSYEPLLQAKRESLGTGSRVLAILDSFYSFAALWGNPTPGITVDFHYLRGHSESRGTFMEYNRELFPAAYDAANGGRYHYFGSIRGASDNEDVWDEGVLFPLMARANLSYQNGGVSPDPISQPLTYLSPDLALIEGMADAMAAILLKSPYLADAKAGGIDVRDIRDVASWGNVRGVYSAPNISALIWDLQLKAQNLPIPGTSTDWAQVDGTRGRASLFNAAFYRDGTDILSVFTQLLRLQSDAAIGGLFSDAVLTEILEPFKITWPRPEANPAACLPLDWGADPDSRTQAIEIPMSMAHSEKIQGFFPNASPGEVFYAKFTRSKDAAYQLSIESKTAWPSKAKVEVNILGVGLYTFDATSSPLRISLLGSSTPTTHNVRIRLLSPDQQQPDTTFRVHLFPLS